MNAPVNLDPSTIGRFNILKTLGQGAQGKVFLAEDPRLQRKVAIKTLLLENVADREKEIQTLLAESHIVSRFQHPNIVTLFDSGEESGTPYLVFEYVEGTTLGKLIKENGALPTAKAVGFAIEMLKGIGYAHQQGVVHRDLKPANVMIDDKGTARVMDFGIASKVTPDKEEGNAFFGTPLYMAPEYITSKVFSPQADIFSAGMILYEMLTGQTAIRGSNVYEILHKIVNEPFVPPSQLNREVDERLDDIVMRALAKKPDGRYQSADEMLSVLKDYLAPKQGITVSGDAQQVALDFLMLKMRHKSDFPVLSRTINVINKVLNSDAQGAAKLSSIILKDFALTNKLIKMVNTAYYRQFGGKITTVSRAVTILGFQAVRNVAVSLMLFDNLQNKAQAAHLKDEMIASFFSAILARRLTAIIGELSEEEAFICSMLHNLGKTLVMFYFPEEFTEIEKLMQKGADEIKAATNVLGLSFEEIGVGIAKAWNFPESIIFSMRDQTLAKAPPPENPADEKLRYLSHMVDEVCRMVRDTSPDESSEHLQRLEDDFSLHFKVTPEQITDVVDTSIKDLLREAVVMNFDLAHSPFFSQVKTWSETVRASLKQLSDATSSAPAPEDVPKQETAGMQEEIANDPAAILTAGILEITDLMVSDYKLNDIMHAILETMYRAIGFDRILLCAVDPRRNQMAGRFGFGKDITRFAQDFGFPLSRSQDIFHQALDTGEPILLQDINEPPATSPLPEWFTRLPHGRSLLLLPIIVKQKPLGFIYGDASAPGKLALPAQQLNLLKTLRNQAILALEKRR